MAELHRGRPRSERSRKAVLEATRDLLQEGAFAGLTIDSIAARSGVSKATIYRWWSSRAGVVAEAVLDGYVSTGPMTLADTGDLRADLTRWLSEALRSSDDPDVAAMIRAMTAATASEIDVSDARYQQYIKPDRAAVVHRLQVAVDRGELRADADIHLVTDLIFGTILYRVLTATNPDATRYAESLVTTVLVGIAAEAHT